MIPTKLSANVFYELPPVLAHYVEQERNSSWFEALPKSGKFYLRDHQGIFANLDAIVSERRAQIRYLGLERARALQFAAGFEAGQADAARHLEEFNQNVRVALQAGPVFRQLQGWFSARPGRFEFDLDARTLYREIALDDSLEAFVFRQLMIDSSQCECACWATAGYFSGHVSQLLERRVIALETECAAHGGKTCRMSMRLEAEWGREADWARKALADETLEKEFTKLDEAVAAARKAQLRTRNALKDLNRRMRSELVLESIVAGHSTMKTALRRARQVVAIDVPVLIQGETGAGRESLARAIHYAGPRRNKPFEVVDCIPLFGHMLTHEVFGYEKDGIPGAVRAHPGALTRANGGTLYLNEISNLTLEAQVMLLRALREGEYYPLGAEVSAKCDVRIIAATQHELREKTDSGEFLCHLYDALSVVVLQVPPLRERGDDILRLAEEFLRQFCDRYDRSDLAFSSELKQALLDCAWPGNVRQLSNVIEHAVIMAEGPVIDTGHLPDDVLSERAPRSPAQLTEDTVKAALRRSNGNRTQAAKMLGIGRTSLWRAMRRMNIA